LRRAWLRIRRNDRDFTSSRTPSSTSTTATARTPRWTTRPRSSSPSRPRSPCGFLGLDTAGNSIPYLTVWSEHTQPDAFERIAALVDRLARRLEDALGPVDGEASAGTASGIA
jgi:hypothetical protein